MATSAVSSTQQRKFYASRPAPLSAFATALKAASVYHATPKAEATASAPSASSSTTSNDPRYQPIELQPWELGIELPKEKEILEALKLSPPEAQGKLQVIIDGMKWERNLLHRTPHEAASNELSIFQCLLALYKITIDDEQKEKHFKELLSFYAFYGNYFRRDILQPEEELYFKIIEYNLTVEQFQIGMCTDIYRDLSPEAIHQNLDYLKKRINVLRSQLDPLPIEIRENQQTKDYRELHTQFDELTLKHSQNKDQLTRFYIETSEKFRTPKNLDECLILARCSLGRAREGSTYVATKTQEALDHLGHIENNINKIEDLEHRISLFEKLIPILTEVQKINPELNTLDRVKDCHQEVQRIETALAAKIQDNARSLEKLSATLNSCSDTNLLEIHLETLFNALKESASWTIKTCPSTKKEFFRVAILALSSLKDAYPRLAQNPHPLVEKMLQYCQTKQEKINVVQPKNSQQERSINYIALAIIAGLVLCTAIVAWRWRSIQRLA